MFALRWKHFDAESKTLSIDEAIYDDFIASPKTKDSTHGSITRACRSIADDVEVTTKRGKTEDFIFAGREGVSGDHPQLSPQNRPTVITSKPATVQVFGTKVLYSFNR